MTIASAASVERALRRPSAAAALAPNPLPAGPLDDESRADVSGQIVVRIDKLGAGQGAAVAARQTKGAVARRQEHSCKRHDGRRLAGAAEREIADA